MTARPGRVLGLDPGDSRIGVAVSDPLGVTAQPVGFLSRSGSRVDLERIGKLVREHEAVRVVVGHPLLLSGEPGQRARDAETLAARLAAFLPGVPVELWDERMTTAQAERTLIAGNVRRRRRREVVDAMAAALILQGWLDSKASGTDPGGGVAQGSPST